jgi:predicted RNA-binding protein YlxR (DUF448 family)
VGPGPGRGAWLCAHGPECFERAVRRGTLARALRVHLVAEAIDGLRRLLVEGGPSGEATPEVWEDGGSGRRRGPVANDNEGP